MGRGSRRGGDPSAPCAGRAIVAPCGRRRPTTRAVPESGETSGIVRCHPGARPVSSKAFRIALAASAAAVGAFATYWTLLATRQGHILFNARKLPVVPLSDD